jgi:predicted nucleotidyltransferase
MKILSNVWALRPFVQGLGESARKVILFGSCAEGTDIARSDIDVLILTDEKRQAKERVSSFNRKSERQIVPVIVDMEEFTIMIYEHRPFFEILERGIALWETA